LGRPNGGAPVFKSVKTSLWPIQFGINELPIEERFSKWNCMVAGLWFGGHEPEMSVFLTPFVLEAQKLYYEGFEWKDSSSGISYLSKVIVLNCSLDSVAKPKVQCVKQFNGYNGCTYCLHVGIMLPGHTGVKYLLHELPVAGDSYEPLYTVNEKVIDPETKEEKEVTHRVVDRTNAGIRQDMEEVASHPDPNYSIRGVKGVSPLIALPTFDLVFGFSLDYLHAVLIGVTKLVAGFWLDSTSHNEDYYIGLSVSVVDDRLKTITPPSTGSLSRRPRSLKDRALWKANEWRAWLLFYSLVCLKGILKPTYYKHHCLLVTAISIFLKEAIPKAELEQAAQCLFLYVYDFQTLYKEIHMNFNVHLLLHFPKHVFLYGPAFCYSTFFWETGNGRLVRLVKGTRSVAGQISKKYVMSACIPEVVSRYSASEKTVEFCSEIMSYPAVKNAKKVNEITLLGLPEHKSLTREEKDAFKRQGFEYNSFTYERMIVKGVKYHSQHYKRQGEKSNDGVVKLRNDAFGEICRIFEANDDDTESSIYLLIRRINVNRRPICEFMGASASHIKVCSTPVFGQLQIVKVESVERKVVFMSFKVDNNAESYLALIPNFYESD